MLLAPLRFNRTRGSSSVVKFVPAPYGGWNARDDLSDMSPEDAVTLDNFIPSESGVFLRDGKSEWATGLGGAIGALME
ncbi:MAG TPA: hypothetical protein VNK48_14660, partial [Xanthobacteraceae bacterium]|nr:hypothetical protein [Xanthobacteraceae bacterium]